LCQEKEAFAAFQGAAGSERFIAQTMGYALFLLNIARFRCLKTPQDCLAFVA
jgi:hypothetical protein